MKYWLALAILLVLSGTSQIWCQGVIGLDGEVEYEAPANETPASVDNSTKNSSDETDATTAVDDQAAPSDGGAADTAVVSADDREILDLLQQLKDQLQALKAELAAVKQANKTADRKNARNDRQKQVRSNKVNSKTRLTERNKGDTSQINESSSEWEAVTIRRQDRQKWLDDAIKHTIAGYTAFDGDGLRRPVSRQANDDYMLDWLFSQGSLYSNLVLSTGEHSSVIVLMRTDPQTGAKEFKAGVWNQDIKAGVLKQDIKELPGEKTSESVEIDGHTYNVKITASYVRGSPILVDINHLGEPDLLAGPAWKKERAGDAKLLAVRTFDLDGTGPAKWEWVGPRTGILVWSDIGANLQPTGRNLFGNVTWGKSWADGYQPLATLDRNADGKLTGNELENLYIWLDANFDAIAQTGEIKALAEHKIVAIAVDASRDAAGNAEHRAGFTCEDGRTSATWDWWSKKAPADAPEINVYRWRPIEENPGIPGGTFVFSSQSGEGLRLTNFVSLENDQKKDTAALVGFPFEVSRIDDQLRWSSKLENGELVTNAILDDNNIIGITRIFVDGKEQQRYSWLAVAIDGKTL